MKRVIVLMSMFIAATLFIIPQGFCEEMTITTYYPSPHGVYQTFQVTGVTTLANNTGYVNIGTTVAPPTSLGLNVVNGRIRFGANDTIGGNLYATTPGNFLGNEVVLTVSDGSGGANDEIWIGPNTGAVRGHIQLVSSYTHIDGALQCGGLGTGTGTNLVFDSSNYIRAFSSSRRYKKDISDLAIDTAKIYQLRPVSFTWKEQGTKDFGLIAEEVQEVFPELVNVNKDGLPESVKYNQLPVLFLEELKKLRQEVQQLKKEVQELKGSR